MSLRKRSASCGRALLFGISLSTALAFFAGAPSCFGAALDRADLRAPSPAEGDSVLQEDTVWRGEMTVTGAVTVAPQATLTVEPGTVVHFRRGRNGAAALVVQGRLFAEGSAAAPIVFTSSDSPAAGEWQGIMLLGSGKNNLLENCRIEGARTGVEALYSTVALKGTSLARCSVGVRGQEALLTVDGGEVRGCDIALEILQGEAEIYRITLTGNRQGICARGASLYLLDGTISGSRDAAVMAEGTQLKVAGTVIKGNGSGLRLTGCDGSISGVKATGNDFALHLKRSRLRISGNEISGNTIGIEVEDGAAVAWRNAFFDNDSYDVYNAGGEEFRAPANWWGAGRPKIFDNGGRASVQVAPLLPARPQPLPVVP